MNYSIRQNEFKSYIPQWRGFHPESTQQSVAIWSDPAWNEVLGLVVQRSNCSWSIAWTCFYHSVQSIQRQTKSANQKFDECNYSWQMNLILGTTAITRAKIVNVCKIWIAPDWLIIWQSVASVNCPPEQQLQCLVGMAIHSLLLWYHRQSQSSTLPIIKFIVTKLPKIAFAWHCALTATS